MEKTRIDDTTVGELFTTDGKDVWRQTSYCAYPSATFSNLDTYDEMRGAVHCPNFENLKRLVPDKEPANGDTK